MTDGRVRLQRDLGEKADNLSVILQRRGTNGGMQRDDIVKAAG